jgi:1,4-dihydroxy-2-naphthoate octaprenyltransferase
MERGSSVTLDDYSSRVKGEFEINLMVNSQMLFKKFSAKARSWIKISRLHFYPMPWIAYSLGAAAAYSMYREFNLNIYVLGYVFLFVVELCSVLTNEYFDFKTDRQNKNPGFFNGGSRVLVENRLVFKEVRTAIAVLLLLILGTGYVLLKISSDVKPVLMVSFLFIGLFLGLGYTLPPLKFSYHGIGEIVVAITFSPYLILCGYVFQSGEWKDAFPWLISIPLLFAIFSAITISGVPDFQADRAAKKRTIAVIFGPRVAIILSCICTCVAALSWVALYYFEILKGWSGVLIFVVLLHALVLLTVLFKLMRSAHFDRKINRVMVLTLLYMLWFGLIPLLSSVL